MNICKQCGVELEDNMTTCPLCHTGLHNGASSANKADQYLPIEQKSHVMQRILWQLAVVLLLSVVFATLVINFSVAGMVTWSIYPISICLMILAYAVLMAWWRTKLVVQLLVGWLLSSLILVVVDRYSTGDWPLLLALPIMSAVNAIGIILYFLLVGLKTKGLTVLAFVFVSLAVAGLAVDAIISNYFQRHIVLGWSVIVAACILPVIAAILFMHFRIRNNATLRKIFHT